MIPEKSNTIVQIEEISHRFGHFEALKNLSLTIRRGDIYGLLGLNGAGKTTTIRILLGLLRRQSGRVMLFGQPREEKWLGLCGRIGATIEGPTYYPHLSGLANLALFHGLSYGGGRSPREALELVGLSEAAHVKTRKYSMGMLQRLYLAQA
ncbi:ABC transporter ATP-binding protein, partial [Candidatus Sumerlaeota bacterium]|nr:ABC transporter ATP-binding protein [Candidatus Sumerlaeota bacterium]